MKTDKKETFINDLFYAATELRSYINHPISKEEDFLDYSDYLTIEQADRIVELLDRIQDEIQDEINENEIIQDEIIQDEINENEII
jgi:hypothetical protein